MQNKITSEVVIPRTAWMDGSVWDREYSATRSIPSSLRFEPSRAFLRLEHSIGDVTGRKVLDLGAGAGRHALYLRSRGATVTSVDASLVACELHRERAESQFGTSAGIDCGVVDEVNLPDGRFDVIIDSYVSCHILSAERRLSFLDALLGCLTPGGRLYTAGMGDGDSFYARHVVAGHGGDIIAVDPQNSIAKLLQPSNLSARDGLILARLLDSTTEHFVDLVGGTAERREVHAAILTR